MESTKRLRAGRLPGEPSADSPTTPSNDTVAEQHVVDQPYTRCAFNHASEKPHHDYKQTRVIQQRKWDFLSHILLFLVVLLLFCLLINYALTWIFWFTLGGTSDWQSPHRYDMTPSLGSNPRPDGYLAGYSEPQEYEELGGNLCPQTGAIQPEQHRSVALALDEALLGEEHRMWAYQNLRGAIRIPCVNLWFSFRW